MNLFTNANGIDNSRVVVGGNGNYDKLFDMNRQNTVKFKSNAKHRRRLFCTGGVEYDLTAANTATTSTTASDEYSSLVYSNPNLISLFRISRDEQPEAMSANVPQKSTSIRNYRSMIIDLTSSDAKKLTAYSSSSLNESSLVAELASPIVPDQRSFNTTTNNNNHGQMLFKGLPIPPIPRLNRSKSLNINKGSGGMMSVAAATSTNDSTKHDESSPFNISSNFYNYISKINN